MTQAGTGRCDGHDGEVRTRNPRMGSKVDVSPRDQKLEETRAG